MEILVILLVIVVVFVYSVPKLNAKYGNAQPQKTSTNSGSSKTRGVRWVCDRCGNDWLVYVDVPKNYKKLTNIIGTKGGFTEIDGEDLYPWICSDCHSSKETHPKK
jgi:hypothetical protein